MRCVYETGTTVLCVSVDEDDPGMGIAQGSGCHPHFFAVGLFFPYDYHPVDGPECPGICGDSPHSGATAGIEKGIGGTGQEEYYQFCITF